MPLTMRPCTPPIASWRRIAAVETGAAVTTTTTATAGIQSTIIVPSAMAAQVAGATATAAEVISLTTFNAMLASTAFKTTVATAGVLLVLGTASTAQAATGNPAAVNIKDLVAFRAVPVNDFVDRGGTLTASSTGTPPDNMYTDKEILEKFGIATAVVYDNKKHWIVGRLAAR